MTDAISIVRYTLHARRQPNARTFTVEDAHCGMVRKVSRLGAGVREIERQVALHRHALPERLERPVDENLPSPDHDDATA